MKFFELQDLLEKDDVIIDYILVKCQHTIRYIKKHQRIKFKDNKLYIQKTGYFQMSYMENKEMTKLSFENSVWVGQFYTGKANLNVEALTDATLIVLDIDEVFDILDKDNLLSHLSFLLLEQFREEIDMFEVQFQFRPKERVARFIKFVSDKMNLTAENTKELPRFFSMDFIASCCCCSRKIVSKALNELAEEDAINFSSKPWTVLDDEKLERYTLDIPIVANG
ncbi:Crp/Fnr family transcriptional regulator [Listeria aquatica]|uniref:Crp/Fnr family transcriptional regulator n=1 Tax=Listeria aquatica TaxID=1494960 RepID=UPI003EF263EC